MNIISSSLRIFNRIPDSITEQDSFNKDFVEYGLLIPEVEAEYEYNLQIAIKENFIGRSAFNNTFWKKWSDIKETPQETLWLHAMVHYFTTYGYDFLGIEDKTVYIPAPEELGSEEALEMKVVGTVSSAEISEFITDTLRSGVALSPQTLQDILDLAEFINYEFILDDINNREIKTKLALQKHMCPSDPDEIVRVLFYAFTGETMVVKSKENLDIIKGGYMVKDEDRDFIYYMLSHKEKELASVFYRFKPLFLAMRKIGYQPARTPFGFETKAMPNLKPAINKIRRLANKYHRPMPEKEYAISLILRGDERGYEIFKELDIYNKIKVTNRVSYLLNSVNKNIYVIRNQKVWVEMDNNKQTDIITQSRLATALGVFIDDIKEHFKGVRYIPHPQIDFALPDSEKNFIGAIPLGTVIETDRENANVIGISWFSNKKGQRTDLDLSGTTASGKHWGWNTFYASDDAKVIYSGDRTDSYTDKAVAEAFYFDEYEEPILFNVNLYNVDEADYSVFFASQAKDEFRKNMSMVDLSKITLQVGGLESLGGSETLGIMSTEADKIKFSFARLAHGNNSVMHADKFSQDLVHSMIDKSKYSLKLSDVLTAVEPAYAIDVETNEEFEIVPEGVVDLREYDKSKILGLITKE